jgi:hypothetical protein
MVAGRPALNALRSRSFTRTSPIQHAISVNIAEVEPFYIPPIPDIFDAPTRLRSSTAIGKSPSYRSPSASAAPTRSKSSRTMEIPVSGLAAPLLFEGPANPRASFLLLKRKPRRTLAAESGPSPRTHHTKTSIPSFLDTELTLTYDGPSKISRFRYSGQRKTNDGGRKSLFLTSFATLAACVTFFLEEALGV